MSNLDLSQFKDFFINDVEENLSKMNQGLIEIEKNTHTENTLDELMRHSHSIKGASATMGYKHMAFLTHVMEDVFDFSRHGRLQINDELIDLLFSALDKLEQSLDGLRNNLEEIDFTDFANQLKQKTGVATDGIGKSINRDDNKPVQDIPEKPQISQTEQTASANNTAPTNEGLDFIKVRVTKLDKLMDLLEEFIMEKLNLEEISKICPEKSDIKGKVNVSVTRLDRLIKETQYHILASRLVPINQVLIQYPRFVRDLAHDQDKTIELIMNGGDIELDRSIIEKISEPLNHLIRNAIDHGIEKQGTIIISASREKDYAFIKVEDNGTGLNLKKIIESALKNKVIKQTEHDEYIKFIPAQMPATLPKIFADLIFNPIITTSEKVTEISGRGVGLAAVKNFANAVGGSITVEMMPKGTSFQLKIPLSLSMIGTLMVRCGEQQYAIPLSSIVSSISIDPGQIKRVLDYDVGIHNNSEFPIIRIKHLFKQEPNYPSGQNNENLVVLVKNENQILGLAVDELIKEQDVVVKPLSSIFKNNNFFSGVTIIGNGKTVPIIDVNGINNYLTKSI